MCEIITRAREIAIVRGLDPKEVKCSDEYSCDGSCCPMIGEPKTSDEEQDDQIQNMELKRLENRENLKIFYDRLQKAVDFKAGKHEF